MNQFGSIQVREGDLLAGKYRIGRVLGVGGMGVVVSARHEQLEQLVAIKFVRDDALDNDEAVERFLREARSAARLKSEHVARVLDVGRLETGAPYMVMEFLEGLDLAQALTKDGPMATDTAAVVLLQACEAVAEAHAAGIVHRDLKPENLFLTRTVGGSPKIKVLDFGVSKSAPVMGDPSAKLTRTRTMLGSPLYMAPEQLRSSRDVDARSDVWSLGVVLFELLSGRSPFEAETMPELCLKIVSEAPLSLARLRPMVPAAMVAVVERCLEKDRNCRFASAADLALALEPFAPRRSSVFSVRPPFESMRNASRVHVSGGAHAASLPDPGAFSSVPRTTSIPAAWDTRESQQPQAAAPRRGGAGSVLGVLLGGLVLAGAAAAFVVLRGGTGSGGPAREGARAASAPPAVSELVPVPPEDPPVLLAQPQAPRPVEPAAGAAVAAASTAAPSATAPAPEAPRAAPPRQAVAAPIARPAPAPAASVAPPKATDDDIPAYR